MKKLYKSKITQRSMKNLFLLAILGLLLINFAIAETTVEYYYGLTCPHCIKVSESGVLERLNQTIPVTKYETWYNVPNGEKLSKIFKDLNVPTSSKGVPFLLINCSGKITYLVGDTPIIGKAENYATTCNFDGVSTQSDSSNLILWTAGIILAGLIILFFVRKK